MLEETAQELFRGEGHGTLFAAMRIVLPPEGDRTLCNSEQSMVGDCYAMRVTGQVMKDMFRAAKGGLGIDNPVLPREPVEEGTEVPLVGQRHALA
jgi:hypothetical protein